MSDCAQNPYMTADELLSWRDNLTVAFGDYTIKPKRDFGKTGYWDATHRCHITAGWIVVKDGVLATPGATWFRTMREAEIGLWLVMASKGDTDVYHALTRVFDLMSKKIAHRNPECEVAA